MREHRTKIKCNNWFQFYLFLLKIQSSSQSGSWCKFLDVNNTKRKQQRWRFKISLYVHKRVRELTNAIYHHTFTLSFLALLDTWRWESSLLCWSCIKDDIQQSFKRTQKSYMQSSRDPLSNMRQKSKVLYEFFSIPWKTKTKGLHNRSAIKKAS